MAALSVQYTGGASRRSQPSVAAVRRSRSRSGPLHATPPPTATRVTMLERAAGTGQVLVGDAAAALLEASHVGARHDPGHLLAGMPARADVASTDGADARDGLEP